jgi:hypothetical protein
MKTLQPRPRFQAATRHYHRYRADSRGDWEDWVDPAKKPGTFRRTLWIGSSVIVLVTAMVALLFRLHLL